MTSWPSDIRTPTKIDERILRGVIRSDFEAGYVQSRSKWTRSRKKFTLNWSSGLPSGEKNTLEDFFDNNLGDNFDWTNPLNGETYTVIFSDDNINFEFAAPGCYTCTIDLEEL